MPSLSQGVCRVQQHDLQDDKQVMQCSHCPDCIRWLENGLCYPLYHILLLWSNAWRLVVADLQRLHSLEETLGPSGVLALRMLYSSVSSNSQPSYHSFLTGMDRCLRHSLEPLDILYFWQQAGAIGAGTSWMAVFAVDEVCMQSTRGF